ncbi:MAG: copper amine oxidase N-terminal domain-containing protein, partial [Thermoanaerobacteraceae bacterium]
MRYKNVVKVIIVLLVAFSLVASGYIYTPDKFKNTINEPGFIQTAYASSGAGNVNPSVEPVRVAKLWTGKQYFVRNAEKIATDIAPYVNKDGRTLVPLRFVAYALGLGEENVIWNEQDQTVTIKADITFPKFYTLPQKTLKRTLVFKIGSPEFTVDGQTKVMDTVPVLVNGRTMLPARFVAENLDYEVLW